VEEMMIRQLEDDDDGDDDEDDEDVNTKKNICYHRRLQKRKRFKALAL
jgi:hypothetical protein